MIPEIWNCEVAEGGRAGKITPRRPGTRRALHRLRGLVVLGRVVMVGRVCQPGIHQADAVVLAAPLVIQGITMLSLGAKRLLPVPLMVGQLIAIIRPLIILFIFLLMVLMVQMK